MKEGYALYWGHTGFIVWFAVVYSSWTSSFKLKPLNSDHSGSQSRLVVVHFEPIIHNITKALIEKLLILRSRTDTFNVPYCV